MTHALNLTLKIKQDAETLARLDHIRAIFAEKLQPQIDAALAESKLVHYARILVIDNLYIQVLTEFDGDRRVYTEFFRQKLTEIFRAVFSLAEKPPAEGVLENADLFFEYADGANLSSLGTDGLTAADRGSDPDRGYFFQAYPGVTVEEIQEASSPA
jgi:hypothetical protein